MTDTSRLNAEEVYFLNQAERMVREDDQEINYEVLVGAAPDEASGEFWFRFAEALSTLPPNRSLDLRMQGGRLTTAASILSGMIEDNPDVPQLWAQKVIALNYLAHGHMTRARGWAQLPDKAADAQEEDYLAQVLSQKLLSTLQEALVRFPDERWFADFNADARRHFADDAPAG